MNIKYNVVEFIEELRKAIQYKCPYCKSKIGFEPIEYCPYCNKMFREESKKKLREFRAVYKKWRKDELRLSS